MKNKWEKLKKDDKRFATKITSLKYISAKITELIIGKDILHRIISTCAVISVDKIRKNATFINKVVIYGERGSGEDADVESS